MKDCSKKGIMGKLLAGIVMLCFGFTGCSRTPAEKAEWVTNKITDKLDLDEQQQILLVDLKDSVMKLNKHHKQNKSEGFKNLKSIILSDKSEPEDVIEKF